MIEWLLLVLFFWIFFCRSTSDVCDAITGGTGEQTKIIRVMACDTKHLYQFWWYNAPITHSTRVGNGKNNYYCWTSTKRILSSCKFWFWFSFCLNQRVIFEPHASRLLLSFYISIEKKNIYLNSQYHFFWGVIIVLYRGNNERHSN